MKTWKKEEASRNIPGNENEARRSHTEHIYPASEFTHSRVDTLHVRTSNPQTFSEKLVLERIQQGRGMLSWKGLKTFFSTLVAAQWREEAGVSARTKVNPS